MASITGLKAEYMLALAAENITSGYVNGDGELVLVPRAGDEIVIGQVVGPKVGGAAGEVFAKNTGDDYDADWTDDLNLRSIMLTDSSVLSLLLGLGIAEELYQRINFRADRFSMADGNRAPFQGEHTVGDVGNGTDSQFFIEGLGHFANLLHLHAARPGTDSLETPAVDGTPTMPMTAGSVTVTDAAELPSTSAAGQGFLLQPDIEDDFARTNSATSAGSGYSAQGGSVWGVNGQQLYNVSGGTVSRLIRDSLATRHRMSVKLSGTNAHINGSGIIFSYVDSSNFLYAKYDSSIEIWEVHKVVAGVDTQLFASPEGTQGAISIAAEYKGGIVSVRFGDNVPITYPESVTAGTKFGFFTPNGGAAGNTLRWDDLLVEGEYLASWTGKASDTLTTFTSTTAPAGAINDTWRVYYKAPNPRVLARVSDRNGSPLFQIYESGEVKLTNKLRLISDDGQSEATFGLITVDPEGEIAAPPGSVRLSDSGVFWIKKENTDDTGWVKVLDEALPINVKFNRYTADHTLDLTDVGHIVEMDVATDNELEVPLNSVVPYPVGTVIPIIQRGVGITTVVAAVGVTVNSYGGFYEGAGQFAEFELKKVATNEWYLSGNLTSSS